MCCPNPRQEQVHLTVQQQVLSTSLLGMGDAAASAEAAGLANSLPSLSLTSQDLEFVAKLLTRAAEVRLQQELLAQGSWRKLLRQVCLQDVSTQIQDTSRARPADTLQQLCVS